MKKLILSLICAVAVLFPAVAQNEGIVFEKPDWKKVVKKAQKENKLIFVDCYTEWCGPCKTLSKEVFPQKAVGDFYNRHFVSVKFDIQKDPDGKKLAELYKPEGVPTLLFFDPATEELIHRVVGGGKAERILAVGQLATDRENNLGAMERRYAGGERGSVFIGQYLNILRGAGVSEKYKSVTNQYLGGLTDKELCDTANWKIFAANVHDPLAPVFQRYMALEGKLYPTVPKTEVDKALGEKLASTVRSIISPSFGNVPTPEEKEQLAAYLRSIYFEEASAFLAVLDMNKYKVKQDYPGLWNSMKQAYGYNVFGRESAYLDYLCLFEILHVVEKTEDQAVLNEILLLADCLLAKGHTMDDYQVKLMMIKANVLAKQGNQAAADAVKEQRRIFEESLKAKKG